VRFRFYQSPLFYASVALVVIGLYVDAQAQFVTFYHAAPFTLVGFMAICFDRLVRTSAKVTIRTKITIQIIGAVLLAVFSVAIYLKYLNPRLILLIKDPLSQHVYSRQSKRHKFIKPQENAVKRNKKR
jgi:hypothetical protein